MDSDNEGSYYMDSDLEVSDSINSDAADDSLFEECDETNSTLKEKSYTILKEENIKNLVDKDISETISNLSITRGSACVLLRHYAWRLDNALESWFSNEEKVRYAVGLFIEETDAPVIDGKTCKICFDEIDNDGEMFSACRKHHYCTDCWKSYIRTSITDGAGCLSLRCPDPSCKTVVDSDMIDKLASNEDKVKYYKYLYRSYVDENLLRKWCPAPGCDFVVQFDTSRGSENYDVVCGCSNAFCWNCCEERHRPVDCETVRKWVLKNSSESENANWLLAYTKQCPKCKRAIEKNQGCNHMTCTSPCNLHFCWNCLKPLEGHGNCNGFKVADDSNRRTAKMDLERYAHYYNRWASNNKSMEIALNDLKDAKSYKLEKLRIVQVSPGNIVNFVQEAWEQIVECRRVLKWSYAYAYYMPQNEPTKTRLFEYLQGEAESALERLHHCAEKDMKKFIEAKGPLEDFTDFSTKLKTLTSVTQSFFDKLVIRFEKGLSEVIEPMNEDFDSDIQEAVFASLSSSSKF